MPAIIGRGDDIGAYVTSGTISQATGSFDHALRVRESGPVNNTGPMIDNAYSLQLNTNHFASPKCSQNLHCVAWEQFIFANDGSSAIAMIEYWLIGYNQDCPSGQG
jgi:hypothetical protein